MKRNSPPPIAEWILEHGIPGRRDDALAGDLLEAYQAGRSNGWYWRQAVAAWLVGWTTYLGDRSPMLVFAALWSMLAPAWTAVIEAVESRSAAWPASVAAWLVLNFVFLWSGIALFAAINRAFAQRLNAKKLKRSFAVAAGVFLPAYFFTFILMNLFAWPGFEVSRNGMAPMRELVDFRIWADVLRLPYFLTLVWSLWGIAPISGRVSAAILEWMPARSVPGPGAEVRRHDPWTVKRTLAFMVAAGLLNALIAGVLICRLPEAHHPSLTSLLARAAIYVGMGALAGVMGIYLYWHNPSSPFRNDPPLPFPLFALVCAAAWMWVPAMVLFYEQVSVVSALVAMIGSLLLAGEIRRILAIAVPTRESRITPSADEPSPLFADTLYRAPAEPHGYAIAFSLYGAGWAVAEQSNLTAALFLVTGASIFVWNRTFVSTDTLEPDHEFRRAWLRLARVAIPAVLVTVWALLYGVEHRNRVMAAAAAAGGNADAGSGIASKPAPANSGHGKGGYVSIILWPPAEKKQIVAPIEESALLAPGSKRPLVIRFDGQYWYMQPPDKRPGPQAHQAHGTPMDVHIASNNSFPLMMEAHETLGAPIPIARCIEIQVEIENREKEPGAISMAVLLTDSSTVGKPQMYLGQQPIVGSEPGNAGDNTAPVTETLRFAVPLLGKIRKFDEITVMLLPEVGHRFVGPRIAVEQFQLLPR